LNPFYKQILKEKQFVTLVSGKEKNPLRKVLEIFLIKKGAHF